MKRVYLWVMLAVLLVGGAGFGTWYALSSSVKKAATTLEDDKDTREMAVESGAVTPGSIIAQIKQNIEAEYELIGVDKQEKAKDDQVIFMAAKSAPVYRVDGFDFYNSYSGGASLSLETPEVASIDEIVRRTYVDSGLLPQGEAYPEGSPYQADAYAANGIYCTVKKEISTTNSVNASCGEIDRYKEVAEVLKPIVASLPERNKNSYFTDLNIEDSKIPGYRSASLGASSVMDTISGRLFFYQKSGEDWKYFPGGHHQYHSCDDFNTDDIRNAFYGEKCRVDDSGAESTVK